MKKILNFLEGEREKILEIHKSAIRQQLINEAIPSKIVPFANNFEGDMFRKFVNDNYPKVAKYFDLDPKGKFSNSYNNYHITTAWNYKVGDKTLGQLYSEPKTKLKKDFFNFEFPSNEKDKKSNCVGIDSMFCDRINPKQDSFLGNVEAIGCSKWASNCLSTYNDKLQRDHAWFLYKKQSRKKKYNLYDSIPKDKYENILKTFKLDQNKCNQIGKIDHADNQYPKIGQAVMQLMPSNSDYDINNLKLGDIVGLYLKSSSNKSNVFCQVMAKNGITKEYKLNSFNEKTINTHVGYVGAIKDGIPIIFHNIDGKLIATPANKATSTNGTQMIVWVVEDPIISNKLNTPIDDMVGVLKKACNSFSVDETKIVNQFCKLDKYNDIVELNTSLPKGIEKYVNYCLTDYWISSLSDTKEREQIKNCINDAARNSGKPDVAQIKGSKLIVDL
jgi:hypothetical protein